MVGRKTKTDFLDFAKLKRSKFCRGLFHRLLIPMQRGRLTMTLPDGEKIHYGQGDEVVASVHVKNWDFFRKCVFYGDIGFGEAYMHGDWETDNITHVIEWMLLNVEYHPTLMGDQQKRKAINFLQLFNRLGHVLRPNTVHGSRKNIIAHYDLSNDFFKLFLDPTMTYSSAYFKNDSQNLQEAQLNKYYELCKKLHLRPTDHVLEVGCGWGGFAIYAAKHYGCHVTGITISSQQYDYARAKIQEAGLSSKVQIKLKDYRHIGGIFDKIVSIEMIEAVGHKFLPAFFRILQQRLKKDGLLGLQMILSPDHRYRSFRKNVDWIQKHIFPGSLLPSMSAVQASISRTGSLNLFSFEDITPSYVKTLSIWQDNFNAHLDKVRVLGFDEAFIRKWNYYLSYCAAAFNMRNISVAQAIFTRPNNLQIRS